MRNEAAVRSAGKKSIGVNIFSLTAVITTVFLGMLSVGGFILSELAIFPKRKRVKSTLETMSKEGIMSRGNYEKLEKKPFFVQTEVGNLSCELIFPKKDKDRKKVVIFTHGHGFNRVGMLKFVPFFLNRGYHIVLYDNRGCGESDGRMVTMGYHEKEDLCAVIDKVVSMFCGDVFLGLAGESMGERCQ